MSHMSGFVFNLFWQTALMSIVGFAALRLAAKASAPTRAALSAAILAALLTLPLPNAFFLASDAGWFKRGAKSTFQASLDPGVAWRFDLGIHGGGAAAATPVPAVLAPERTSFIGNAIVKSRTLLRRWAPLGGAIWVAGAAFMLARLLYGLALLRGFRLGLKRIDDRRFAAVIDAALVFNPERRPSVFLSSEIESPLTIGLWRPVMVLPEKLYGTLREDEIKSIVLHELSHIHHYDHLAGLAKRIVVAANWWNPLVYRIGAEHSIAREEISDNYALLALGPKTYAGCLVGLAEKTCLISGLPAAIGMADVHVSLEQRVRNILSCERNMETRTDKTTRNALMTGFCGLAVLLGGAQYVLAQENVGRASPAALVMPGANVMVQFDLEKAKDSPIYKRIAADPLMSRVGGLDLSKLEAKLKEYGLLDNGGKSFTLYMAMDDLFFDSPKAAGATKNLGLLFGVELKKALSMKQVEELAQAVAASDKKNIERFRYKGYKLLSVTAALPGAAGGPTKFLLGMDANGKLLFGGLAESVKAAIGRMESGTHVALGPEMSALGKTGPFGAQYRLAINVPEKARRSLRSAAEREKTRAAAAGKPMGAGAALKQIDSLVVSATLGDNLDLDVRGNFATPEACQLLNDTLTPLLALAKARLPKLADGKPATALEETLKSEVAPGATMIKLKASLSPEDLNVLDKTLSPARTLSMRSYLPINPNRSR